MADRVETQRHDLTETFPAGEFDLVSAQFLQSPLEFHREHILRSAARAVAPDGVLLVVAHAEMPPWSGHPGPPPQMPTPATDLAALDLPAGRWTVERQATVERAATGPDGQPATLVDSVLAVRRLAGPPAPLVLEPAAG